MEQRLEGGKVPGCKFRVPTRPGAPAEKGVVLSTGSGSCPSLPARWGRPVGLSGACLRLTHSAPPRPPLRLAPGLFRGGAAGRYCVLKATAGLGCSGGVEPQVPEQSRGSVWKGHQAGSENPSSRGRSRAVVREPREREGPLEAVRSSPLASLCPLPCPRSASTLPVHPWPLLTWVLQPCPCS